MFENAAVVLANNYQFRRGEVVAFELVQSRMLLWCLEGDGMLTVNGELFNMLPGVLLLIPWEHQIRYQPGKNPFLVAGVHVIPEYERACAWTQDVVHLRELDRSRLAVGRSDSPVAGLDQVICSTVGMANELHRLTSYAVARADELDESMARHLGPLILREMGRLHGQTSPQLCKATEAVIGHIQRHLRERIGIDALAEVAGCSQSTLFRLLRKDLGLTPSQLVNRERVAVACELLRNSQLRVGEIGEQVGIADPYYFSRVFRQEMGVSAREYRKGFGQFSL